MKTILNKSMNKLFLAFIMILAVLAAEQECGP